MAKYASKVVEQAKAWLGKNETDGSHRAIIDIYNSHEPLARGYKVTYTDAWCAATVSAIAIKLGYTDIIPTECSCTKMIELFKKLNAWTESDSYRPNPGDIIFYDWDDSGRGDNKGSPDHVGIVEFVSNGVITVIEGNYKNAVMRRKIAVNGKYVRGYGVPRYDAETGTQSFTATSDRVFRFQQAAIADNLPLNVYGADSIWGIETATAASEYVKNGSVGNRVMLIQQLLVDAGYNLGTYGRLKDGVDGYFGKATEAAVRAFQAKHGLVVDGIVGIETWKVLLGVTA